MSHKAILILGLMFTLAGCAPAVIGAGVLGADFVAEETGGGDGLF